MTDRVLLITGASRGLGAATARRAAAAGYRLALVSRNAESLAPLVEELGADKALALAADVADWDQISGAVAATEERFGRLDAAFANAGQMLPVSFFGKGGTDPRQWREMVLTNVYGTAITARAALPALAKTEGHLVLTGSVAGRYIRPANLYSATKWAVTGLAGSIRAEAVGTGVRVTLVQPGIVETELITEEMRRKPKLDPDDIARAVCYALEQPKTVDVNEIVVRPTGQDPER
ncbi:SDR family NAD(P)-dependent oxidoreductase [Amycolatopsis acidicola]|uniref:SDR family NAD(P)-dependent oxidoreductase n=1 Tax=Amycolatopsis acidicola TaxID=2596893 RepID=A0A5N0UMF1_9PSEU|nr:SDR family NAD(P)-dependent oxidoreductase [Amycolatopsis acidicola]KAA9148734.1 SDR family NAD(P)-dependent oxidoreductase [Amycolatopsis acidicola]